MLQFSGGKKATQIPGALLNNLGRLLPSAIIPLFVDLQGPASRASDHAAFPYSVAQGMSNAAA